MSEAHIENLEHSAIERSSSVMLTNANSDVHSYDNTYQEIRHLRAKFWGIDTGHAVVPHPQTPEYKVKDLRRVLRTIDDLPPTVNTWARKTNDITAKSVEKLVKRPVTYKPDLSDYFKSLPNTAIEAYRLPAINEIIHANGIEEDDPIIIVINGFERLLDRVPYRSVSERGRLIGSKALEIFAFSAGGVNFAKKVVTTAQTYFDSEHVRLTEIEKARKARAHQE